jgi:hypothetical protein
LESWAIVFLGVIALCSVIQAAFLIWLGLEGRRLSRRVEELHQRIDRDVTPILQELSRIARNLSEVSDLAVLQARRLDDMVVDTIDRVDDAVRGMRRLALRPLGPIGHVAAFFKGLRRGLDVYRQLSGLEPRRPNIARHDGEDEHLFI